MNFGDYSGEYKSKVFRTLMSFFDVNIEALSKLTGFTETHISGILKQDVIDKAVGKRILASMNLTNNDYDWINTVLHEVEFDRTKRLRALEEIRFNQRQYKLEKERVKKSGESTKEETESNKRVKTRRGSKDKEVKVKGKNKESSRKILKKRKGGQKEENNVQQRKRKSKQVRASKA